MAAFMVGGCSDSIVTLNHSLLQRDNIDAFCLKEAVSYKNHNSGNFDAARMCLLHLEKRKNVLQI